MLYRKEADFNRANHCVLALYPMLVDTKFILSEPRAKAIVRTQILVIISTCSISVIATSKMLREKTRVSRTSIPVIFQNA